MTTLHRGADARQPDRATDEEPSVDTARDLAPAGYPPEWDDVAPLDPRDLALMCGGRTDHVGEVDTSDSVTILVTASSRRATKRWRVGDDGSPVLDGYDAGYRYATRTASVACIEDLAALLDRLARMPRCLVIRGAPREGVVGTVGRRLLHDDPTRGDASRYVDVPRRWVAHDLDRVPLGRAYDVRVAHEARAAMEALRAQLSIEWRRAACYATLTSSAGTGDPSVVSARLWYWCDRPVSRDELVAWADATHAPVDRSIYGAVQPIYTAAPVYDAPLTDPITARAGMLDGDPVVWLPDYRTAADLDAARASPRGQGDVRPYTPRPRDDGAGDTAGRRYARATLDKLARDLAAAPEGERHRMVHHAARRAGGLVPGGWLGREEILDELLAAALAAGMGRGREGEVRRTVADAIDVGARRWAWDPPERAANGTNGRRPS